MVAAVMKPVSVIRDKLLIVVLSIWVTGVTAPNPLPCREHLTALQWVEHRCYMRRLQGQKRWQCEYVKMRRTQKPYNSVASHNQKRFTAPILRCAGEFVASREEF